MLIKSRETCKKEILSHSILLLKSKNTSAFGKIIDALEPLLKPNFNSLFKVDRLAL